MHFPITASAPSSEADRQKLQDHLSTGCKGGPWDLRGGVPSLIVCSEGQSQILALFLFVTAPLRPVIRTFLMIGEEERLQEPCNR